MLSSIKSLFSLSKSRLKPGAVKPGTKSRLAPNSLGERIAARLDLMAFSWPVRQAFYRHMSAQISNGVAVEAALEGFRTRLKRQKKPGTDKIIAGVARRMRDGSTLSAALTKWIPADEASVLSSGELSGNLPRSLNLVIEAKRRIERVNSALKSSMVTPAIYILAVYGMLWAIGRYVTPGLEQVLSKEKARGLVSGLYAAGDFANSLWALLPPVVLAWAIAMVVRSLPVWTGPRRVAAESFFPYSFYRDIQGYTWLLTFAALLRAGMADVEILKRQAAQSTPWLKERLHALWWRMDNGASMPAALMSKGRNGMPAFEFPNPDIVEDISSMDGFSDFADRISALAVQWADELESSTLARAKSFGFAMEILMYVVMGLLMIAINSMSAQMGNVPGM